MHSKMNQSIVFIKHLHLFDFLNNRVFKMHLFKFLKISINLLIVKSNLRQYTKGVEDEKSNK